MRPMSTTTVESAKKALGMKFDAELADWFGVRAAAIYNWRQTGLPRQRLDQLELWRLTGRRPNGKRARA